MHSFLKPLNQFVLFLIKVLLSRNLNFNNRSKIKLLVKSILQYYFNILTEVLKIFAVSKEELNMLVSKQQDNFIQVQIMMLSSGVACECAMLSTPTSEDIAKLKVDINDIYTRGFHDCVGPSEPSHDDPDREKRFVVSLKLNKSRIYLLLI